MYYVVVVVGAAAAATVLSWIATTAVRTPGTPTSVFEYPGGTND
jgi:hypothetical protein